MVMAGLKWPPEMWPSAQTMMAMVRPYARAMPRRPRAFEAWGYQSTQAAPAAKKIRANVPRNSAVSFCPRLYIKEPPGRGTSRVRCDREGFYLEREEKRQPFGKWVVHEFPNNGSPSVAGPAEKASRLPIPA